MRRPARQPASADHPTNRSPKLFSNRRRSGSPLLRWHLGAKRRGSVEGTRSHPRRTSSAPSGLIGLALSLVQSVEEAKESVDPGEFEKRLHPIARAHQRNSIAIATVTDIHIDQSAHADRVEIGHMGKVENQVMRPVPGDFGLEFRHRRQSQRPGQANNARSIRQVHEVFDKEVRIRHDNILHRDGQPPQFCVLWVVAQFSQKQSYPSHSEARFIGEESASCQQQKQQIPRATIPRFGMTIPKGVFKLHQHRFCAKVLTRSPLVGPKTSLLLASFYTRYAVIGAAGEAERP